MLRTQQKAYAYISAGIVLFVIGLVLEELHYYASDVIVRSALRMVPHIIHLPLLVVWCVTLKRRIINKQIRKYLMSVAILMIFWLAIRTFKWHFLDDGDPLGRYIWYCYYIPMILIPLLGVFITMCIGKPENFRLNSRLKLLYIPAIILIVFILTNDFHNLTFSFPGDITEYNSNYKHEIVFFIACAWFVMLGFYFATMLILKSRVPGKRTFQKLPLVMMVVAVVLWLAYVLNILRFDLTAMDCLIIVLLLESAIQSGLIASNTAYNELFEISTLAAQIIDKNYEICYSSSEANDFMEETMRSTEKKTVIIGGYSLHSKAVKGGRVLWQNDIKQIRALMNELSEKQEQLNENNELLKAEIEIKEQKARLEEKNRLYDRIAIEVSEQLTKADELLSHVEKSDEDVESVLSQICIISAYIKRRSNLLLINEDNNYISAKELEYCLRESLDNMRLMGIITSLDSSCKGKIKIEHIVEIYDVFEKIIEFLLLDINAILVHLTYKNGNLKLRLQIGCDNTERINDMPELMVFYDEIKCEVQENDIIVDIVTSDGGVGK